MNEFNVRDYLFKDRPGEIPGRRLEVITTLLLGFTITVFWTFTYRNPMVVGLAAATGLIALFSIIQTARGKTGYPTLTPVAAMSTVIAISIYEGNGLHDLIWMGSIGLFLLANIYNTGNITIVLSVGAYILLSFIAVGVLEISGVLPNPYNTDIEYLVLNTAILVGTMLAILAVFYNHRNLLVAARVNQEEQIILREQMEKVNTELELQVRQRTDELKQVNDQLITKNAKLSAASEISHEITENPYLTTNELLTRTAKLISEKLGYYHVGIFIVDTNRGYAVLRAANSKGGQEMLAKRHQLKVGGAGVVGYVSQSGRPRIALDTGADAVYFNNPYLPETRSEISLPIKFSGNVIGVLDVQSTQPAAFSDEDINTLMTIANQLALILQQQADNKPDVSIQRGKRQYSKTASWEQQSGYSFKPDGSIVSLGKPEPSPTIEKALSNGEIIALSKSANNKTPILAVPVKFREQVVGVIQIETEDASRIWTEDEIQLVQSISDRAAVALENARLLEDATRRAEQEEMISHVTTQIGSSTDFERIMQTTIQELGLALGASRSFIQLSPPAKNNEDAK